MNRGQAAIYFLAQGLGVVIWWVLLLANPDWRAPFFSPNADPIALSKFLVPDVVVMGGFSVAAGWLGLRRSPHRLSAALLAVGAVVYALAGALAVNWPIGTRPWADLLMIGSVIGSVVAARGSKK
ncbi:MAG TPA: hypothetical protein PLX06_13765 [Fimbriimonadaceae bacterium]|nr:hypothetical protein [Fimbriimonadaceae bacterium]